MILIDIYTAVSQLLTSLVSLVIKLEVLNFSNVANEKFEFY